MITIDDVRQIWDIIPITSKKLVQVIVSSENNEVDTSLIQDDVRDDEFEDNQFLEYDLLREFNDIEWDDLSDNVGSNEALKDMVSNEEGKGDLVGENDGVSESGSIGFVGGDEFSEGNDKASEGGIIGFVGNGDCGVEENEVNIVFFGWPWENTIF